METLEKVDSDLQADLLRSMGLTALRQQFVLLRPTWNANQPTSTWNFYGVEITAFKA
jgi:hypothetical protein